MIGGKGYQKRERVGGYKILKKQNRNEIQINCKETLFLPINRKYKCRRLRLVRQEKSI